MTFVLWSRSFGTSSFSQPDGGSKSGAPTAPDEPTDNSVRVSVPGSWRFLPHENFTRTVFSECWFSEKDRVVRDHCADLTLPKNLMGNVEMWRGWGLSTTPAQLLGGAASRSSLRRATPLCPFIASMLGCLAARRRRSFSVPGGRAGEAGGKASSRRRVPTFMGSGDVCVMCEYFTR